MSRGTGIVLISGGLDSLLAARVLMDQEIQVIGFHCILPFVAPDADPAGLDAVKSAERLALQVRTHRCGGEYIDMIRNPEHGFGKRANPCIDCHIYFFKKAGELMHETRADFVATGEVVGQRPMSQMRNTMNHIEKETGLSGRLLRPLSAKLLRPTIPEVEGIVDRNRLLDINGRSRRMQFDLADKYGIEEYQTPSGGCLFTDPFIARRVQDLFLLHSNLEALDFFLLSLGRHLRISERAKIIVGRNRLENVELEKHRESADIFCMPEFKGPAVYGKGVFTEVDLDIVGRIMLRYGKAGDDDRLMKVFFQNRSATTLTISGEVSKEMIEMMRI